MTKIGALITRGDVERAVLSTLQSWLPVYLAEIEYDRGLTVGTAIPRPPAPTSYHGGVDHESWDEDRCPEIIVTARPVSEPERSTSAGYGQRYDCRVAAVVWTAEDENASRALADLYGSAIMGSLLQQGSLGGFATRTVLTASPDTELVDTDIRILHRAVVGFEVFVQPIIDEHAGLGLSAPPQPIKPPYGDWPIVTSETFTVLGQPILNAFLCNTYTGNAVLTGVAVPSTARRGMTVYGPGIPSGSYIVDYSAGNGTVTISQPATATANGVTVSLNAAS